MNEEVVVYRIDLEIDVLKDWCLFDNTDMSRFRDFMDFKDMMHGLGLFNKIKSSVQDVVDSLNVEFPDLGTIGIDHVFEVAGNKLTPRKTEYAYVFQYRSLGEEVQLSSALYAKRLGKVEKELYLNVKFV